MTDSDKNAADAGEVELTEEQRNGLISAIANDIYRRASFAQAIQLVQTQCTNQANDIVTNASKEEIIGFLEQINKNKAASEEAAKGGSSESVEEAVDSEENTEK